MQAENTGVATEERCFTNILLINCKYPQGEYPVRLDHLKSTLFGGNMVEYFKVDTNYFRVNEMQRKIREIRSGKRYDLAVFVVHADEPLSINEKDTGYAKIYKALSDATRNAVIVVIAHDTNYTNPTANISLWALNTLESQFQRRHFYGPDSYVVSWKDRPEECHRLTIFKLLLHRKRITRADYNSMVTHTRQSTRKEKEDHLSENNNQLTTHVQ